MNTSTIFRRFLAFLCLGLILANPMPVQAEPATAWEKPRLVAATDTAASCRIHANKVFDYIRGNRSRMVQVATIALGIGLVILMTATRKS